MCVTSMIADHYRDKWNDRFGQITWPNTLQPVMPTGPSHITVIGVDQAEFNKLKAEVEELKALLAKAKKYDEETGQRDCEMADKVALVRKVAEMVGVDLGDVLPPA